MIEYAMATGVYKVKRLYNPALVCLLACDFKDQNGEETKFRLDHSFLYFSLSFTIFSSLLCFFSLPKHCTLNHPIS
jgi:hypothetical protein